MDSKLLVAKDRRSAAEGLIRVNEHGGKMSTSHDPGDIAAVWYARTRSMRVTSASGPLRSILYPYATLRITAPAMLVTELSVEGRYQTVLLTRESALCAVLDFQSSCAQTFATRALQVAPVCAMPMEFLWLSA